MSSATDLTEATFQNSVASGITLVDFWAEWCAPCRMMGPILDEITQRYGEKVKIGKVDVDSEMQLAQAFGISSIPTLLIVKDGQEMKRFIGVTPPTELAKAIDAISP